MEKKITIEALHHIPDSNYCYAYDKERLHLRIKTKKGEVEKIFLRIGDPYIWDEGGCDGGNMNSAGGIWTGAENFQMEKECETEYFDHWIYEYKPPKKRSRYAFILENSNEKLLFTEKKVYDLKFEKERKLNALNDFYCFPYLNNIDVQRAPEWTKNTIWYQIFPDRFNNGDEKINPENVKPWGTEPTGTNFMGGDIKGIIEKLDYLKDLGITGIYLCPIFKATENHRYDTIDYFEVDNGLGDKKIFRELVDEAHKRGMRIMLDAVFNHIGYDSMQWQDVIINGETSVYKDWFYINKFPVIDKEISELDENNLNYEVFGRNFKMPKLNTENEEVIEYLLKVGEYWINEMDIDGWRLDVCNEIDHCFWRKFKERITKIKPDVYILGEIWHNAIPWLKGDQFHAVMNYPLGDAVKAYFCYNNINLDEFIYMVNEIYTSYSRQVMETTFNLLDSHDTPRLLTVANGNKEKFKLALLFIFTNCGSPCIYYGTEIGLDGNQGIGEEFHRRCMVWNEDKQDRDIFEFIKKLIKMRNVFSDVREYKINWLKLNKSNILMYKKGNVIIILNNSNKKNVIELPKEFQNKNAMNCFSDEDIFLEKDIKINGYGFYVIKANGF